MRTAPAPNIPPIPGMNPGVLVMGGGGSGGGGSGKGGGKGSGDASASGNGGGEGANGGGKGAQSCGTGSPGQCNNCGNRMSAGDPVDIASGAVLTLPILDVTLPGLLPLNIARRYSSGAADRDRGLGFGWTHSLAWEINVRGKQAELIDGAGSALLFEPPAAGDSMLGPEGWRIVREAWGFALENDGIWWLFSFYDEASRRYLLTAIEDRNKNRIALTYEDGRLAEIVDAVGRVVRVGSTREGRIAAFEVKTAAHQGRWIKLAAFSYDEEGNLLAASDAEGHTTAYTYDGDHLLTSYTAPDRPTFHFLFDDQRRCVQTWGAYPDGSVPGLAADVPQFLADRRTPARGFNHAKIEYFPDGYREVVDSVRIRRVFSDERGLAEKSVSGGHVTTRTFDENGFLASHTDALLATTYFQRDARGRLVGITDALGNATILERDDEGQLIAVHDALGTILRARYDGRGNVVELAKARGETTTRKYDARGNVIEQVQPNGGRFEYERDAHGNIVKATEPSGAVWRYAFDFLGRCTAQTDPRGAETRFAYDNKGRLIAAYFPNGGSERLRYNGVDELVELAEPDGQVWRAEYLVRRMIKVTHPGGQAIHYKYDREGALVEIHNEKGEVRRHSVNDAGVVTEVVSFDGRREELKLDAMNRVIRHRNGQGELTEIKRDLLGRIVEMLYPDGSAEVFEYDARGRLVRAKSAAGEFLFELDEAGQLLRETHAVGGESISVEHAYDVMRLRTSVRSSLGAEHAVKRDVGGKPVESLLNSTERIGFAFDAVGRELRRAFGRGGAIVSDYGLEGGVTRRRAIEPAAGPLVGAGEPDWVGPVADGSTVAKAFEYSRNAENVVRRWDKGLGTRVFEYDAREQLVGVALDGRRTEGYRYDPAGNVEESGVGRVYGPGGALERRGHASYSWDAAGRLIEKTELAPDGTEHRTLFEWNGQGYLAGVRLPDGSSVAFSYDPFARRLEKNVFRPSPDGELALLSSTRYVWDKDRIFQEIRRAADEAGDPLVEETTYVYEESLGTPLAQRTDVVQKGARTEGEWRFYVNDPIGTPEELVTGAGQVVAEMRRTAWGKTETAPAGEPGTRLRFKGQLEDPETGLHYNRYRYYDPEAGRYISPDPAGNLPDPNEYRYSLNPIGWVDPLGLAHHALGTFTPAGSNQPINLNGGSVLTSSYSSEPDGHSPAYNKQNGITPFKNLTARQNGELVHRTSDTEAQFIRELEGMQKQGQVNLKGGHLAIVGELSPCSACHKKMTDFAKKHNATVEYHWLGNPNAQQIIDRTPGSRYYP